MKASGFLWLGAGLALAACDRPLDMDFRSLGDGFSTTEAALAAPSRPAPDERGIIAYPTYQVVVARPGDTVGSIAARLGFDAAELAAYNGVPADRELRRDEIVALPRPVAAAIAQTPVQPVAAQPGVGPAPLGSAAPAPVATSPLAPVTSTVAPAPIRAANVPPGVEPIRHRVQPGETAHSIARLYGVSVTTVAEWNGLGADLAVREGQVLLVPPSPEGQAAAPAATPLPGTGSETPVPPSAALPLPTEEPVPAAEAPPEPEAAPQDMAEQQTEPAPEGRFASPADGPIIRAYAPGRNEGIDIGAAAGSAVRAADAGTVAAITTNTDGVQIVVIRHAGGLLTVYTNLDDLTVAKDDSVGRGERIGSVRAGDPAYLHFEVREGMTSKDPADFLP